MDIDAYANKGKAVNDSNLLSGLLRLEGQCIVASAEEESAHESYKDAKKRREILDQKTHEILKAKKRKATVYQLDNGDLTLTPPDKQRNFPGVPAGGKATKKTAKKTAGKKKKS